MDYYGADGLLYCGKCQTPKEALFPKGLVLMGKNKHPVECDCHKAERERQEATVKEQKHHDLVREQLFSLTGVLLEAVEAENAEQQAKLKGENENG